MVDIEKLLNSEYDYVKDIANKTMSLRLEYEAGKLNTSEFYDLMDDLLDITKIQQHKEKSKNHVALVEAVQILIQLKDFSLN